MDFEHEKWRIFGLIFFLRAVILQESEVLL